MNNMRRALVLLQVGVLLFLAGCIGPQVAYFQPPTVGASTPWTEQVFRADPNDFQFAIVSDRHGDSRPGVFEKAVAKLNLLQPEFVLCVGDLIDGYTEDRKALDRQYGEMDEILRGLEMRFFRVVGNHDISNPVMLEVYRERYGLPYYHFLYKNVLFLVVSTEDGTEKGSISSAQVAYMQKAIRDNQNVRWTFVFMHKPLFAERQGKLNERWAQIEGALVGRPHTVVAGHWHNYAKCKKHGQIYIHLATTGGRSKLRGIGDGEFDHIVWVTMTDAGPTIANLMLDGIYDENVRLAK
jgi:predicted phosphodiesterase